MRIWAFGHTCMEPRLLFQAPSWLPMDVSHGIGNLTSADLRLACVARSAESGAVVYAVELGEPMAQSGYLLRYILGEYLCLQTIKGLYIPIRLSVQTAVSDALSICVADTPRPQH